MLKIAWKNIWHKPLSAILSLILFALGIGLVSFLSLFNYQAQEQFDKNLANIDLVLGAKGSPLQLILCAMYHIDNPTGNILLKDAAPFLNPNHPLIAQAVPLSIGDSYRGFRIVGTTNMFPALYQAEVQTGSLPTQALEVTVGHQVAQQLNINIGDTFSSTHGLINDGMDNTHEQQFKVVGILQPSGAVIDQLIITPLESIWAVHESHQHSDNANESHEHEEDTTEKAITAILIKYKSKTNFNALNLPRNINANTTLQAAVPAMEMNRLYAMLGVGENALKALAMLIMIVSGISIFIALFNNLKERRYELALIRVLGATPLRLFTLILAEGIMITMLGSIIGFALSHISMQLFAKPLQAAYKYSFTGYCIAPEEQWIGLVAFVIGLLAAMLPAYMAYRTDISKTLGGK